MSKSATTRRALEVALPASGVRCSTTGKHFQEVQLVIDTVATESYFLRPV